METVEVHTSRSHIQLIKLWKSLKLLPNGVRSNSFSWVKNKQSSLVQQGLYILDLLNQEKKILATEKKLLFYERSFMARTHLHSDLM